MDRKRVRARRGWDRVSRIYDRLIAPLERFAFAPFRAKAALALDPQALVLEIGAGTGANFHYLRRSTRGVAVDSSLGMLARAARRTTRPNGIRVVVADAEHLPFRDNTFEAALATLVFCNIERPEVALCETRRVLERGAPFIALEHVRPEWRIAGLLFDALNMLTERFGNEAINRRTVETIADAGFHVDSVKRAPILRLVMASNPVTPSGQCD